MSTDMANVLNGVETLRKISIAWVGYTNVTDDRQTTDGGAFFETVQLSVPWRFAVIHA